MTGGGGFFPSGLGPDQIKDRLKRSLDKTKKEEFDSKIAEILNDLLKQYNDRDSKATQDKLEEIRKIIESIIEDTIDLRFGGSISRHTYIDGLSDIDALVILNDTELINKRPEQVQDFLLSKLKQNLKNIKSINKGTLAVTIEFNDGMVIQLLPAVKVEAGFKIPSYNGTEWSEINPTGFANYLTRVNQDLGGKAVPSIKIIKSINAQFPEKKQMTGYHIESLAIEAFKSYDGEKTVKALIKQFFDKAKELVISPIKDKTGQSLHVDDYLGPKNSEARKAISYQLDIVSRKMRSADNTNSIDLWKEILGEL